MTRVDEIAAAMKSGPAPMFLIGIAVLANQDFHGIYYDLALASEKVYREREGSVDVRSRFMERMRARKA